MPRWAWFLPVALLAVFSGWAGWELGFRRATLTETEAIAPFAARYVDEAGPEAAETDCVAVPGEGAWLVLSCGRAGGPVWVYRIGRFGQLIEERRGAAPQDGGPRT